MKIITLGDIFENIETEEKAFKFLKYIKDLQHQLEQKENILKEVREKLLCYGETFDNKIHQQMQKELLEILDKEDRLCGEIEK